MVLLFSCFTDLFISYRAVFTWFWKIIRFCFGFAFLRLGIGLKNSHHLVIQSESAKPKSTVIRLHLFSRASRQLHIFVSNFDWLTGLFSSFVIAQSDRLLWVWAFDAQWKPLQEIQRTNINYFCYEWFILSPPQFPFQDGVQILLDYNSLPSYSYYSGADKPRTTLQWIMLPFKILANALAVVFNFLVEIMLKFFHCVVWPFRFLKNQTVALYEFITGLCSFLNQKIQKQFEDPMKIIDAVLEVIWLVVSPFIRAVTWLCEIIIIVKRYIKVGKWVFSRERKNGPAVQIAV